MLGIGRTKPVHRPQPLRLTKWVCCIFSCNIQSIGYIIKVPRFWDVAHWLISRYFWAKLPCNQEKFPSTTCTTACPFTKGMLDLIYAENSYVRVIHTVVKAPNTRAGQMWVQILAILLCSCGPLSDYSPSWSLRVLIHKFMLLWGATIKT